MHSKTTKMEKAQLTYILFNFGYISIFSILTAVVTLLNMPKKDPALKSYRKSIYNTPKVLTDKMKDTIKVEYIHFISGPSS